MENYVHKAYDEIDQLKYTQTEFGPKEMLDLRYKSRSVQKKQLQKSPKFTFPKGTIVFHGGYKKRNQYRCNRCCFFTTLNPYMSEHYIQYKNSKNIELRAYILTRDITLNEWFMNELTHLWGWDCQEEDHKECPGYLSCCQIRAERDANFAFEQLGLMGKFSTDSSELMFTTHAYQDILELSIDFSDFIIDIDSKVKIGKPVPHSFIKRFNELSEFEREIMLAYLENLPKIIKKHSNLLYRYKVKQIARVNKVHTACKKASKSVCP